MLKAASSPAQFPQFHMVQVLAHVVAARACSKYANTLVQLACSRMKGLWRARAVRVSLCVAAVAGQPVLIGGTMGTCSYVLTGTEKGFAETFGSTCHGAGEAGCVEPTHNA